MARISTRRVIGSAGLLAFALCAACEPVPPSGDVFAPAPDTKTVAAVPAVAPTEPVADADFDFDAEDRKDEPATPSQGELSPAELMTGLGLTEEPVAAVAPEPEVAPEPPPVASTEAPAAAPAEWPPAPPAWGVRLVSTVPDAQPPRAILGLADGSEHVVTPGTLLPAASIVVLAIGRDAVQIAEVTPAGDHATIETRVVQALYPGQPPQR